MPAFNCGACGHPQRGGSRYKVTADNLGGVRALMMASGRAGLAALLTVGMALCTISRSVKIAGHPATVPACVSEADKAALKDSLVGRQVSRLLPDAPRTTGAAGTAGHQPPPQQGEEQEQEPPGTMSFYNGTITGVAAGEPGSWTVEFQAPAGPSTMVLTQSEAECCMQSFNSLARLLKKKKRPGRECCSLSRAAGWGAGGARDLFSVSVYKAVCVRLYRYIYIILEAEN